MMLKTSMFFAGAVALKSTDDDVTMAIPHKQRAVNPTDGMRVSLSGNRTTDGFTIEESWKVDIAKNFVDADSDFFTKKVACLSSPHLKITSKCESLCNEAETARWKAACQEKPWWKCWYPGKHLNAKDWLNIQQSKEKQFQLQCRPPQIPVQDLPILLESSFFEWTSEEAGKNTATQYINKWDPTLLDKYELVTAAEISGDVINTDGQSAFFQKILKPTFNMILFCKKGAGEKYCMVAIECLNPDDIGDWLQSLVYTNFLIPAVKKPTEMLQSFENKIDEWIVQYKLSCIHMISGHSMGGLWSVNIQPKKNQCDPWRVTFNGLLNSFEDPSSTYIWKDDHINIRTRGDPLNCFAGADMHEKTVCMHEQGQQGKVDMCPGVIVAHGAKGRGDWPGSELPTEVAGSVTTDVVGLDWSILIDNMDSSQFDWNVVTPCTRALLKKDECINENVMRCNGGLELFGHDLLSNVCSVAQSASDIWDAVTFWKDEQMWDEPCGTHGYRATCHATLCYQM